MRNGNHKNIPRWMAVIAQQWLLIGLTILTGCRSMTTYADLPARITNPTDASRNALQMTIDDALNTSVLIAEDALMSSDTLTIERRAPGSIQRRPATGRNMDRPIRFRLVVDDSACILIDTRDDSRHLLGSTTCIAL